MLDRRRARAILPRVQARSFAPVVVCVVVCMLLAGCGVTQNLGAAGREDAPREAVMGVLVPLTGTQAAAGNGVVAAVRLAVADVHGSVEGWSIEVVSVDDDGDPATAAEEAEELAGDERLVGVVGGLSGPVVRAVQPVLDRAEVIFVSPADTDPAHTRGADLSAPLRPYDTYFRTSLNDADEGSVAADHILDEFGEVPVATVTDGSRSGGRVTSSFTSRLVDEGGSVVAVGVERGDGTGAAEVVATAVKTGARAVYVAGDAIVLAAVLEAMAEAGWRAPVVASGQVREGDLPVLASNHLNHAVGGVVATSPPPTRFEGRSDGVGDQSQLAGRLAAAGLTSPPGPFADTAYDAAVALLDTSMRCLPTARDVRTARPGCVAEMSQVGTHGITGPVAFTEFGERAGAGPGLWRLVSGTWEPLG